MALLKCSTHSPLPVQRVCLKTSSCVRMSGNRLERQVFPPRPCGKRTRVGQGESAEPGCKSWPPLAQKLRRSMIWEKRYNFKIVAATTQDASATTPASPGGTAQDQSPFAN